MRLNALLRVARVGLGILSLLLGIGLVAITFNTIRLQVLTLAMRLSKPLAGATDAFISRPFFYLAFCKERWACRGLADWRRASLALAPRGGFVCALWTECRHHSAVLQPRHRSLPPLRIGWLGTALSLTYLRGSTMTKG